MPTVTHAASALRFPSSERLPLRRAAPRTSPPLAIARLVGRARELERLARGLGDVPVALICGVPGAGKSALAAAHAATWPGPTAQIELAAGATIAQLIAQLDDAVHRRLGAPRSEAAVDDAGRLDALWAELDALDALLVVDDLHHLAPASRSLVLDTAAHRLHAGRLIATSRALVALGAGAPDRLQLRLDGLDRAEAAQLWDRLVELYGPSGEFEAAWQRSHGNPALLRHAHVAARAGEPPLLAAVAELDAAQRRIAGALALSRVALPRACVLRLGGPAAADALDALVDRLLVDATADARHAVPELVRDAVLAGLDAAARDALRAALVEALPGGELDAVAIVQESARHLRALGRSAELAALLVTAGPSLIRQGAAAALLDELLRDDDEAAAWRHDAAPPVPCGPRIRAQVRAVLRVACSAEAPRAHVPLDVAIPVSADYAFDRALFELARAVLATRQGRARRATKHVEEAMRHAATCHADPSLIPALYGQLRSLAAAAATTCDAGAAAPAAALVIDGARHEVIDGTVRVSLASRIVLRQLLYAFVTADGHRLDRGAIAHALWHCDYAPLRHNSSIKSNIRRLRDLLEGTRVVIETDQDSYRLAVPPGSVLVPPRP